MTSTQDTDTGTQDPADRNPAIGKDVEANGIRTNYLEAGSGKPILMIPGWSQTAEQFRYQLSGLSDRYRCVLFDFRSHGRSARAAGGDLSPLAFGHDLAAVLAAVGAKPVLLVGHSMGAMSMLAMAETEPELFGDPVAGVVFVGSAASDLVRGAFGSVTELLRPRLGSLRQAAGVVDQTIAYAVSLCRAGRTERE